MERWVWWVDFTVRRGKVPIFWHNMLDKCPEEELRRLDPRGAVMIWLYNGRNIDKDVTALKRKLRHSGDGRSDGPLLGFEG